MRQAILLFGAVTGAFGLVGLSFGLAPALELGYGAIAAMSGLIAGTFLWLWRERATPLALGMAFSWAGTATVMAWWWLFAILGRAATPAETAALLPAVALQVVGAVLHFAVMQRSMGYGRAVFLLPILAALAAALSVTALL